MAASPAITDGVVYVPNSSLYALNESTGALLWSYTAQCFDSPVVAKGVVYDGSCDGNVYALDATTGAVVWIYSTGAADSYAPAVANGVVYVGDSSYNGVVYAGAGNDVYAVDANTGVQLWSYPTGDWVGGPAVANGVVYASSYDNNVYALNASTGALLGNYNTSNWRVVDPVVVDGTLYVGANGAIYAFGLKNGR